MMVPFDSKRRQRRLAPRPSPALIRALLWATPLAEDARAYGGRYCGPHLQPKTLEYMVGAIVGHTFSRRR
ncbi:hypothetical protein GGTG_05679 [Gaeumannomyces tritici R3-111a-1]|uniref:Uncharacterized protein n=1 Tax=Gaeumannomyces tritici (strain R3-111a-1) TaxID=644352 RepID=J3NWL7_GAET3|nr:hypothetical protein GGTG_05679 [Gaeumannomyces tritici R3-111a-1]EJT75749.1 hypothetical protein GGTG_05679 [Gaeumannomyces tritici R3-111a-1]